MAGNKNSGRKPRALTKAELASKMRGLTRPAMKIILDAIEAGDVNLAKWAIEMQVGRPRQRAEVVGDDGGPVVLSFAEAVKQMHEAGDE